MWIVRFSLKRPYYTSRVLDWTHSLSLSSSPYSGGTPVPGSMTAAGSVWMNRTQSSSFAYLRDRGRGDAGGHSDNGQYAWRYGPDQGFQVGPANSPASFRPTECQNDWT
jgi:hypothetical protein